MVELPRQASRYAVIFRAGPGPAAAGAMVVGHDRVLFEGRSAEGRIALSVPFTELTEVRIGRSSKERLNGRPTLLLKRNDRSLVQVEPLGLGLLHELADLLAAIAARSGEREEQVAVVVPLKAGRLRRARELVAQGPPFDPAALGFTRHEVFLAADEAIFVFTGPRARATLQRATRDPTLWRVGLAWQDCVGGAPHLAATHEHPASRQVPAYRWTSPA